MKYIIHKIEGEETVEAKYRSKHDFQITVLLLKEMGFHPYVEEFDNGVTRAMVRVKN